MTSPPKDIQVTCPQCGHIYQDWYRPSINLNLDDFDDEYIERATTATCPLCQFKVFLGGLVVDRQGRWTVNPAKSNGPETKAK